ncbi:MAG TPA: hypothetical protein VMF86_17075 [Stellaceae bacterium]|nr:hypothetical protein [Stellaceae bacterium]
MSVDVETVSRTMAALLAHDRRRVVYHDCATGGHLTVDVPIAASPAGLLPAFLVAGEAVWREASGSGFALDIVRDPQALFGYRLRAIGADSFASVMLAMMEATAQAAGPQAIVVNGFAALWSAAGDRTTQVPQPAAGAAPGATP